MADRTFNLTLTGIGPLIMHWDNIEWADQIDEARSKIKKDDKPNFKAGDDRCPPDTWKGCVYNDGTHVAVPTDNLRSCLLKAGAKVEFKGKETYKRYTQTSILFLEPFAAFENGRGPIAIAAIEKISGTYAEQARAARQLGFRLLAKRARVGQSKHLRVRPVFDKWTVRGQFILTEDWFPAKKLREIWTIGGLREGLCDWRPGSKESPGPHGRFSVELEQVGK